LKIIEKCRRVITLRLMRIEKIALINDYANGAGLSQRMLCDKYKISKGAVCNILQWNDKYKDNFQSNVNEGIQRKLPSRGLWHDDEKRFHSQGHWFTKRHGKITEGLRTDRWYMCIGALCNVAWGKIFLSGICKSLSGAGTSVGGAIWKTPIDAHLREVFTIKWLIFC
jgi:hypothetical protein